MKENLLVIIEHRVHVFNPDGVDRSVQDYPFSIFCLRGGVFPERVGQHSVCPLVRNGVELSIELAHCY